MSWTTSDREELLRTVPDESRPERVALTGTAVFRRSSSSRMEILLANPHPETWNNWLLPYGSLVLESPREAKAAKNLGALTSEMRSMRDVHFQDYRRAVAKQLGDMFDVDHVALEEHVFFENFSLKFSKSAKVWTAYCFGYHLALTDLVEAKCEVVWLPLDVSTVQEVLDREHYADRPVADNIVSLLQNRAVLRSLGVIG